LDGIQVYCMIKKCVALYTNVLYGISVCYMVSESAVWYKGVLYGIRVYDIGVLCMP